MLLNREQLSFSYRDFRLMQSRQDLGDPYRKEFYFFLQRVRNIMQRRLEEGVLRDILNGLWSPLRVTSLPAEVELWSFGSDESEWIGGA